MTAVKDKSVLQELGKVESAALIQGIAHVALTENSRLPDGLLEAGRSLQLLLNALLVFITCGI